MSPIRDLSGARILGGFRDRRGLKKKKLKMGGGGRLGVPGREEVIITVYSARAIT